MTSVSYGHIWKVAWPLMVGIIAEQLIGLTDTAFLGRVGEVELGASTLALVYLLAVFMLGFGFSLGAQILIARRNGEENYQQIGPIFYQGLFFLMILAGLMFVFTRLFSPAILEPLLSSRQVYQACLEYIDWRIYGFFFAFALLMFRAFFLGIEQTRILTVSSFIMVGVNVVLNYVLIFGKLGFPAMGIGGAALASVLAEAVAVLFLLVYTWRRVDLDRYGFRHMSLINFALVRSIFGLSIWTMIQYLLGMAIWFAFMVAVEHLGERPIAITNIVRSYATMLFMPVFALAGANVSIVSNLMGAGQHGQVMGACWKTIKLAFLIILPPLIFGFIWPEFFVRIYTDNHELVAASTATMRVGSSAFIIATPALILFQAISGTGNTRAALIMDLLPCGISAAHIYFAIITYRLDVALCWTNEHVYWTSILLISWLYLKKAGWWKTKI